MNKIVLTFLIVLFLVSTQADKFDWPAWRGPDRNGISKETKWNPKALENGAKIKWKKNVGKGYASVSIKGKYLFTMGNKRRKDTVYCLNRETGKVLWSYSYKCKVGSYPGTRATPVISGKYVYTMSREGHVFCFDGKTGKVHWKKHLESLDVKVPRWGFSSSPLIFKNMLLLNVGLHGIALSKRTGKVLWTSNNEKHPGYATPVSFQYKKKNYIAMFGGEALYIIKPFTGEVKWSYSWKTSYQVNAADPIIRKDHIFISSGYNQGAALLKLENNKLKKIWRNEVINNHFSTSVLIGDYIYGVDGQTWGSCAVKCINFHTGKEKWSADHRFGSLMAANGKLIFLDAKGYLFIITATPTGYKELSKAKVLNAKRGAKCWTVPVLCNGMIFCRSSSGNIVCVNVSK